MRSPAELLADEPGGLDGLLATLTDTEAAALLNDWRFWARPEQIAPDWEWRLWAVVTGRGWGKSRTGSEWTIDRAERFAEQAANDHLIGLMNATYSDVRQIQIGGISGIERACERRGHRLDIGKTSLEGRLRIWVPGEGWHDSDIEIHTADQPDRVRGRNFHTLWMDEAAKWKHKVDDEGGTAFTNADLGLRMEGPGGIPPQGIVTTTPKPIKLIRELLAGEYGGTAITRGSMFDNRRNLAPSFIRAIMRRYVGSRLGAQEIEGAVLDDIEGALWSQARLSATRHDGPPPDNLHRVVVAVDPAGGGRDEVGIVVAGIGWVDGAVHLFVLDDRSGRYDGWAQRATKAYHDWHADILVAERNYGGDMVREVIMLTDSGINYDDVNATRGKAVRAEPVAVLWNEDEEHGIEARAHICGTLPELEAELTTWVPGDSWSPGRLDAVVWAAHALIDDLTEVEATQAYGAATAAARL